MKKILALAALSGLLSACTLVGNPLNKDVSGMLQNFPSGQTADLRLAIVGYNNGQYTADGSQSQVLDRYLTGGFTLDLPRNVPYGTYRVVVYRDSNKNDRFDTGDRIVSRDNGKLLVYSRSNGQYYANTRAGWNIYNTANRDVQVVALTGYDLFYNGS